MQQLHKFRLHECVVVSNVQADHPGILEMSLKPPCQLAPMSFLHNKHDIGPFKQFWRASDISIIVQTCGHHFDTDP